MASNDTDLKAKFSKILKDNDIDDAIAQVTVSKPNLVGQHMGSVIEVARVDFEDGNKPPLELFLKKRLPSSGVPMMDDHMKTIMKKEGSFLREFTQELSNLCKERTNGSSNLISNLFPKTYYYDEDVIVMENLIKQGYICLNKTERQDFKDASMVVRALAKFHAVSYVLVENAGGSKKFLENNPNFNEFMFRREMADMLEKAFGPGFELALGVLEKSTHEEKDEKLEILSKHKGKLVQNMIDSLETESLFTCVLHGDCWNNNLMFSEARDKVILVDLQIARVGSPNSDLGYFIFTSTRPEVRRRWKELLQIYFDSLKSNVESLGQAFEFTFEDFVQDFIRKSKLGFFSGFFLILGMEAMGSHDTSKDTGDISNVFTALVTKWIQDNPDKAEQASASMVSMVNDYLLFGQL